MTDGLAPERPAASLRGPRAPQPPELRATPMTPVRDAVAQKLLLGFLQNRHQTLYPLSINFRTFDDAGSALLMRVVAVSLLAGGTSASAMTERVDGWLNKTQGGERERATLAAALADPQALSTLLAEAASAKLGAASYAVALAVLDQRQSVNRRFLEYLAVRLAVPSDIARSLAQRYRR